MRGPSSSNILRSIQQNSWGPTNCLVSRLRPLKYTCNIDLLYPYMNLAPHSHKSGHQVPRNSASDIDQRIAPQGIAKVIGFRKSPFDEAVFYTAMQLWISMWNNIVTRRPDEICGGWNKVSELHFWCVDYLASDGGNYDISKASAQISIQYTCIFLSQTVLHTWNIFTHK